MNKNRLLKTFSIFMLSLAVLTAKKANHGFAIIEKVRNNSDFPLSISSASGDKDLLPDGSVVKIKSLKPEYGPEGKYYAVRNEGGSYFLKADAQDPTDQATELVVHSYVTGEEQWLGLSSLLADGQMLRASNDQSTQFSGQSFENESETSAHWKLSGGSLLRCGLQNRMTSGFLSARNKGEKKVETKNTLRADPTKSDAERLSLQNKSLRIGYGDIIRIVHNETLTQLTGSSSRYSHSGSSGNAIVFAKNSGKIDENSWIIKGSHKDNDRYNCPLGRPVKASGSIIRLEHVMTGKNLHCSTIIAPKTEANRKHHFEVSLFGSGGIGNDDDNWSLSAYSMGHSSVSKDDAAKMAELSEEELTAKIKADSSQGSSDKVKREKEYLHIGDLFILNHASTEATLFSEDASFSISSDQGSVDDERTVWEIQIRTGEPSPGQEVRYRDKIALKNSISGKLLFSTGETVSAITEEDIVDSASWRIKGPHKDNDRWNARNDTVPNKAVIRLESSISGENLYSDSSKNGSSENLFLVKTKKNSAKGVGDSEDDWQLKLIGSSGNITHGSKVTFEHLGNLKRKKPSKLFAGSDNLESETDPVWAKSYTEKKAKTSSDPSNHQVVSSFNTTHKDRIALQEKLNKFKEEDRKNHAEKKQKLREEIKDLPKLEQDLRLAEFDKQPKDVNSEIPELEKQLSYHNEKVVWFIDSVKKAELPTSDIAWTGFPGGAPAEEGTAEAVSIEIAKIGAGATVGPKETVTKKISVAEKSPTISGFGIDKVIGFDKSYLLNLSPLLSKGAAWLEKSLEHAGKTSVTFLARAEDKGDIQVLFGTDVGTDYIWKVVIGAGGNKLSQIIKRDVSSGTPKDVVVAQITKEQNIFAATKPGNFIPYWVSINDGEIIVGSGHIIGKRIFMSWKDLQPRSQPTRIGFSTHKSSVEYTGVQIGDPVGLKSPKRTYATIPNPYSVSKSTTWLDQTVRVRGRGTVSFFAKGPQAATVAFSSDDEERSQRYTATFTSNEKGFGYDGTVTLSKWDNEGQQYIELISSKGMDNSSMALSSSIKKQLWVTLENGRIFVGQGEAGKNPFLYYLDSEPLDDVLKIGLNGGTDGAEFSDIQISSPVQVEVKREEEAYSSEPKPFKGDLIAITPYRYSLSQEGQAVKMVDVVNSKTFYSGKTPQQGAKYFFILQIGKDGFPELSWMKQPENSKLTKLKKSAYIARMAGIAFHIGSGYTEGPGPLGGLVGSALSIGYAAAGMPLHELAAKENAKIKYGYRDHNSYVNIDEKQYGTDQASATVPDEASKNLKKIKKLIEDGSKWQPSNQDKLDRLIALYQQATLLVSHPYTIRDEFIKDSLMSSISTLYQAHKELHAPPKDQLDLSYTHLMNLIFTAYNNIYFKNAMNSQELQARESWLGWANQLARDIMEKSEWPKFNLKPSHGEYIWLKDKLPNHGRGSIMFKAKATNDIMVCVSPRPTKVRNTDNEIYEVSIGSSDNKKSVIRARNLDKPAAETQSEKLRANSIMSQQYWISVNDGRVVVGKNAMSEKNAILEWQDPYPTPNMKYIGIGSWDAPVQFESISVGEPL